MKMVVPWKKGRYPIITHYIRCFCGVDGLITVLRVPSLKGTTIFPMKLPSLKLTVRTWKWIVGIGLFPFEIAYFQGLLLWVSGRVCLPPLTSPDWQNFGHSLAESPIHGYNPDAQQESVPQDIVVDDGSLGNMGKSHKKNVTCNDLQIRLEIFKNTIFFIQMAGKHST